MSGNRTTDLLRALTELVKAGLAFTTEEGPDGTPIYVIDRIRLSEDEVLELSKRRILTPQSIHQFLISRVA